MLTRLPFAAALAVTTLACGGSSNTEVRTARSALYACDFARVFQATSEAVAEIFPPLGPVDPDTGVVTSELRWYEADGSRKERGMAAVQDRAVHVAAIVKVVKVEGGFRIQPSAEVRQIRAGLSAPVPLAADDPERPPFVQGKLDTLAVEIHERLAGCAPQTGAAAAAPVSAP